jgi:hypothetical protein
MSILPRRAGRKTRLDQIAFCAALRAQPQASVLAFISDWSEIMQLQEADNFSRNY